MPPPDDDRRGGSFRSFMDRINEAAQSADPDRRPGHALGDAQSPRPPAFDVGDIPDLTPIAGVALVALAALIALTIGGSVASVWETVLLWINRVPFSPDRGDRRRRPGVRSGHRLLPLRAAVPAARPGAVQRHRAGRRCCWSSPATSSGRRAGASCSRRPVRVHLAVLGGLFLLSVAFGYQLDKYELVYSTRGVLFTGVSFTDQNAQFLAYDVLTVLSGLAGALLVGGAFTRMLWPLGLTIGVWLLASLIIGRLYPEAIQRFTVQPNQYAQEQALHRQQHRDDPPRLRDRPLGGRPAVPGRGGAGPAPPSTRRRRRSATPGCGITARSATRSTSSSASVATTTSTTSTPTATSSTTSSARSCCPRASWTSPRTRAAAGFVNQRIVYTHGIGAAMVPVNEVTNEGQPRLFIRNLPPVSSDGAPEISEPRIYFGEKPSEYVITGARQAEFDYPTGEGEGGADPGTETRWQRHDRHPRSTRPCRGCCSRCASATSTC